MNLIEVNHLSKSYDGFRLQDISFSLPAGFIMGYVGQNGAGKTTTLNAMMHLITPDSGETSIDGLTYAKDPLRYRDSIGYIGDASFFPVDFTAMDIENILRDFYPSFNRDTYREEMGSFSEKENQRFLPGHESKADVCGGTKQGHQSIDPRRSHQRTGSHDEKRCVGSFAGLYL